MPLDTNETNQTISFSKTYKIATPKIFALSTKKQKNESRERKCVYKRKQTNKQVNEAHKMEKRKFSDVCPFSSRKWNLISDKRNLEQKRNYNQILEVQKYIWLRSDTELVQKTYKVIR